MGNLVRPCPQIKEGWAYSSVVENLSSADAALNLSPNAHDKKRRKEGKVEGMERRREWRGGGEEGGR